MISDIFHAISQHLKTKVIRVIDKTYCMYLHGKLFVQFKHVYFMQKFVMYSVGIKC